MRRRAAKSALPATLCAKQSAQPCALPMRPSSRKNANPDRSLCPSTSAQTPNTTTAALRRPPHCAQLQRRQRRRVREKETAAVARGHRSARQATRRRRRQQLFTGLVILVRSTSRVKWIASTAAAVDECECARLADRRSSPEQQRAGHQTAVRRYLPPTTPLCPRLPCLSPRPPHKMFVRMNTAGLINPTLSLSPLLSCSSRHKSPPLDDGGGVTEKRPPTKSWTFGHRARNHPANKLGAGSDYPPVVSPAESSASPEGAAAPITGASSTSPSGAVECTGAVRRRSEAPAREWTDETTRLQTTPVGRKTPDAMGS
uniref:Uncharacterized protein n=1 Tax=Plectus sambesii TaxID=2011161 RepID=A0A914XT17_9BILA